MISDLRSGLLACRSGLLACLLLAGLSAVAEDVRPKILERLPHDPKAFTQGLMLDGDVWLEGTGRYGKSDLREVDRQTGEVLRRLPLPPHWFGEGIVEFDGKIYQLTWLAGVCRVVDRETFKVVKRFQYPGEGWGITTDGRRLYMSDGTPDIRILDPETFEEQKRITVKEEGRPIQNLNELEWIDGEIWANIWQTKRIVRIDPKTGEVLGGIDLSHLPLKEDRWYGQDVLNGIAVDPENGEIWVTGKLWKALYRIAWPPREEE